MSLHNVFCTEKQKVATIVEGNSLDYLDQVLLEMNSFGKIQNSWSKSIDHMVPSNLSNDTLFHKPTYQRGPGYSTYSPSKVSSPYSSCSPASPGYKMYSPSSSAGYSSRSSTSPMYTPSSPAGPSLAYSPSSPTNPAHLPSSPAYKPSTLTYIPTSPRVYSPEYKIPGSPKYSLTNSLMTPYSPTYSPGSPTGSIYSPGH
eukprot:TRINITY_DN9811_c0_g1_i1.p1 TRINITY_DN9811_c0_g1~~TRINITY_DN9811_c0_g1_i1.p1  ORF type:complete len:200 (-),score=12.42 TRINITY_DN9811_c0_g1_i1:151-750(-)